MKPRSESYGAIGLTLLAVFGILYTFLAGNEPLLGLDLQGGVSVVYEPKLEDGQPEPTEETLDQTVEIIRDRVDGLGVAEPEISRQGQAIVVDLPGVDEQQRALELVGQTAELRFRPVIAILGPALDPDVFESLGDDDPTTGTDSTTDTTDTTDTTETTASTETTAGDPSDEESTTTTSQGADDESEQGLGVIRPRRQSSDGEDELIELTDEDLGIVADEESTTTTTDDTEDETTEVTTTDGLATDETDDGTAIGVDEVPELTPEQQALQDEITEACNIAGVTEPEDNLADNHVVLAGEDGNRYCLGPALLTGDALESADVGLQGVSWSVLPVFKSGPDGIDAFNAVAAQCFAGTGSFNPDICPTGQLAIALDQQVISAPSINAANFSRDDIVISGSFDEESARNLALVLNYGALPVELEAQQVRTVSATIGDDVLQAGIIAGLIGLAIVALYLLWYYRLAGLVAIGGLLISFLLLWTVVAWLGATKGLAITLSGVVGLIVSIGVSADSNIVYFENVKDTVATGTTKKLSTAVERAYKTAISTIIKADVVSLIAAMLLYWLTVGAVRGFAFYLGLATLLDLVVSWLFMRPALAWIARRPQVRDNPKLLGIRSGVSE